MWSQRLKRLNLLMSQKKCLITDLIANQKVLVSNVEINITEVYVTKPVEARKVTATQTIRNI